MKLLVHLPSIIYFLERLLKWKLKFIYEVKQEEIFEKFALGDFVFPFPYFTLFANSYWLDFNEKYSKFNNLTSHLFSLYDFTPFFFHMRCRSWGSWGAPYPLFSLSKANPELSIENRMTLRSIWLRPVTLKRTTTWF